MVIGIKKSVQKEQLTLKNDRSRVGAGGAGWGGVWGGGLGGGGR